jgi:hypothetical protein
VDNGSQGSAWEPLIARKLAELTDPGRLAFIASLADRLAPSYEAFATEVGLLGGRFVARMVEMLFKVALNEGSAPEELSATRSVLLSSLDDARGRSLVILESGARYAVRVADYGLAYIERADAALAVEAASTACAAAYAYVRLVTVPLTAGRDDAARDAWLEAAPLVIEERERQLGDVDALVGGFDARTIERMRAANRRAGIQPFERGLYHRPP